MPIEISRYHDISCGHRVVGHEGKCIGLHGHNYRITFHAASDELDALGRVIDFAVLKSALCEWLEMNWDHRFLLWGEDEFWAAIHAGRQGYGFEDAFDSFESVPFNPTAENMAEYLLREIGPQQLAGTGVYLTKVVVEETRKCSAIASL